MMEEVTDREFEEAKHLEYRELCGIISYAATCTKLVMRYSISICGRHRSKWGKKQFNIMMKVVRACKEQDFAQHYEKQDFPKIKMNIAWEIYS
jgi:hypothetical protein